ncbi:XdhC family protein [Dietzia maris]|uniref:XdhC family protein n=1 Tax=Dietzia maris TaxID=37915 RepID=UPI00223B62C9|nr:XdhC/CoxI family protein [Dietzia maris]MCT1433821.1 XdhC family protein [Dietzia maris]MCT1521419.1 XdhC family protein [Dietzia maris]
MDIPVAETLARWRAAGVACALARVVATGGSAPLAPGTAMAVSAAGEVVGGVSGGCVDAAVYTLCEQVIADGHPALARFGPDGDELPDHLLDVGPTCGGSLEVFVEPLAPAPPPGPAPPPSPAHPVDRLLAAAREGHAVVAATVLDGPCAGQWMVAGGDGGTGVDDDEAPPWAGGPVAAAIAEGRGTGVVFAAPAAAPAADSAADGAALPARVFLHRLDPPRLLVFGATAFAEALVPMGAQLGYRVTVCDARPVFAAAERFPAAAEVVRRWPHQYLAGTRVDASTAICVLTHDPRFDIPLLVEALRTRAGYIGAMGSRRTHTQRMTDLRAEGVPEAGLQRVHSPIGLDLGARTAAETALSIAAELVAHRRGGTGAPLVGMDAAIHR